MKPMLTKKSIKNNYKYIIKLGYCDLYSAFYYNYEMLLGHVASVNGWDCDVYQINNDVVIATGYRPIGNIHADSKIIDKYKAKEQKILKKYKTYKKVKEKLTNLLNEFVDEVLKNEN